MMEEQNISFNRNRVAKFLSDITPDLTTYLKNCLVFLNQIKPKISIGNMPPSIYLEFIPKDESEVFDWKFSDFDREQIRELEDKISNIESLVENAAQNFNLESFSGHLFMNCPNEEELGYFTFRPKYDEFKK